MAVKNEKQYEALKDKGMSKKRGEDRELAEGLQPRRQEEWIGWGHQSGWHHRPEEEGQQ
jgi:hypothetical protein